MVLEEFNRDECLTEWLVSIHPYVHINLLLYEVDILNNTKALQLAV